MNLYLDPQTHDLALEGGRLLRAAAGPDQIAQSIKTRLLFWRGESLLDTREGVPYATQILGVKNPDLGRIRGIFLRTIRSVPGVRDVTRIELELDAATRALTVEWVVRTTEGGMVRSEDYGPLLLEV